MAKKEVSPKELVDGLRKKFGNESAMLMGDNGTGVKSVCPTGIGALDRWVLGIGGIPWGRVIESFGGEGAGKTTITNRILAGAQRDGGIAVLAEVEHAYDPAWAKMHGVDVNNIVFLQPDYIDGEKGAFAQFENLVKRAGGRHVLIALDSLPWALTKREFDEGVSGDAAVAERARIWSKNLPILSKVLADCESTLVIVNQTRNKIGVMYGNPETTPGGNAVKFSASIRLAIRHGKHDGDTGRFMKVQAVKNKLCAPFRDATLKLDYTTGFNERWATLNHAKDLGCVAKDCKSYKEAIAALGWEAAVEGDEEESSVEPTEESATG